FDLPDELVAFREAARDFARREIAPRVEEAERAERTPRDLFVAAGRAGFLGIRYPESVGGSAATCLAETILREEIGYVCSGLGAALSVSSHLGTYPVHAFGTEEQQERYLRPALSGDKVSAFALTEPDAGSDVRAITTKAVRTEAGWLLSGRKTFITNAPLADFMIVVAYTDPSAGIEGMALFIVDLPAEGLSVIRLAKMGNLSSEIGEVVLDDVAVPAAACLGGERGAFKKVMETLNVGRVLVSGGAIGVARAALDAAVAYANDRHAFGHRIGEYQGVSFPLARAHAAIEGARLATYKAACLFDAGRNPVLETSTAKLLASEAALFVTDAAMRTFGGYGYMREYPIERYYRDARYFAIVEGTSEIHQRVIAREIGL
ncbi:MAG: acyl-CoA dehydrogenase family protein, partial [Actinomycetota bacterium]|nr:acyl-CoA dehydrogenase family protein [Actinomycetota bacterium]